MGFVWRGKTFQRYLLNNPSQYILNENTQWEGGRFAIFCCCPSLSVIHSSSNIFIFSLVFHTRQMGFAVSRNPLWRYPSGPLLGIHKELRSDRSDQGEDIMICNFTQLFDNRNKSRRSFRLQLVQNIKLIFCCWN